MSEEAAVSDLERRIKRKRLELEIAEKELEVAKAKKTLLDLEDIWRGGSGNSSGDT